MMLEHLLHQEEVWNVVGDIDAFLRMLYVYHLGRGWRCLTFDVTRKLVEFLTLIFVAFMIIFCINWSSVTNCSMHACANISLFTFPSMSISSAGFIVCASIISFYRTAEAVKFVMMCSEAQAVYTKMGITDMELRIIPWSKVVNAIITHNKSTRLFLRDLTCDDITAIIMRHENMLIALVSADVIPMWIMCPLLEKILMTFVIHRMFNRDMRLKNTIDKTKLSRDIRMFAIVLLVVSPIFVLARLVHVVLHYMHEIRGRDFAGFSHYKFTHACFYRYRNLNELKHEVEARLNHARTYAYTYIYGFPTPMLDAIRGCLSFGASALVLTIMSVSVTNEDVLLHARPGGISILWSLALVSLITAASKAKDWPRPTNEELRDALQQLGHYLRNAPPSWSVVGTDALYDVRTIFRPYFMHLAHDAMSFVFVPGWFVMHGKQKTVKIFDFLLQHSEQNETVGTICKFGNLQTSAADVASSLDASSILTDAHSFESHIVDAFIEEHMHETDEELRECAPND